MERGRDTQKVPPEQEAVDVDRLLNEGGNDTVSDQELARRRELWNQKQNGTCEMTFNVEQRAIDLLQHMARRQGVSLQTLVSSVLDQYCNGVLTDRNNVQ